MAHAKDSVPDWVRSASAQPLPVLPPSAEAVVLLEETTYTVAADGTLIEHVRKIVRILRPQGRRHGEMYVMLRGGSKIRSFHLWSIGANGHEYAVKDDALQERAAGAGFELYSDLRVRGGEAPAMEVGAVAAMEYEKQDRPMDNDIIWVPGESIPVLKDRLTLELPPGFTYQASWKGKPKAPAVDAERGRTLWEITGEAALHDPDRSPLTPDEFGLAPRMDIFFQGPSAGGPYGAMTGDWRSIGEWYERLAKDRNRPDPAIAARAQELVQGKTGFRERVESIAAFVQSDVRYVAIEIGIGGYQPHAATDTFRARYGDCKDKATLLSAMLSAVGIRSTWVLVDTRRGVMASEAPSLMGNHMIAAIELPADYTPDRMYSIVTTRAGKRYLIFDPTWEKTPFGQLERELQGSDALLVDGAASQVIRLPVLRPEQNVLHRQASFQLAADGSISGKVTENQAGDIARDRRYLFTQGTQKEQEKELDRTVARDLLEFKLTDIHVDHAAELQHDLTLSYALQANHFAQDMGSLLTVRPRVLGEDNFPVDTRPRKLPIDFGYTHEVRDEFTIALPAGVAVEELPPPVKLDVGFASYTSESSVRDRVLHYARTYTVREIALPAERYGDVLKLARTISADEQSSAVLKRLK